jgi:hypothetical protein
MSEVTVVVDQTPENAFAQILANAQAAGLKVGEVHTDTGSIEGLIESCYLPELRAVEGVKYIRISMEYVADFPVGDPRDHDKVEDD